MNNFVYFKGNLVKDLEQRFTPSGQPTVNGYMAINEEYTTKQGEVKKTTLFIGFDKFGKYEGKKGDQVSILGSLRQWKDKETEELKFAVNATELYIKARKTEAPSTEDIPF